MYGSGLDNTSDVVVTARGQPCVNGGSLGSSGPPQVYIEEMQLLLLTLLMLTSPPAQAGDCEGPEDCGLAETVIPDFALVDENTRSATSGRTISRDELLGEVLLIYWAQAT